VTAIRQQRDRAGSAGPGCGGQPPRSGRLAFAANSAKLNSHTPPQAAGPGMAGCCQWSIALTPPTVRRAPARTEPVRQPDQQLGTCNAKARRGGERSRAAGVTGGSGSSPGVAPPNGPQRSDEGRPRAAAEPRAEVEHEPVSEASRKPDPEPPAAYPQTRATVGAGGTAKDDRGTRARTGQGTSRSAAGKARRAPRRRQSRHNRK